MCATGVSAHPNAGLPNEMGEYDMDGAEMAVHIREWAQSGFLNIVGGCCGTSPAHIKAIAEAVAGIAPRQLPELGERMPPFRARTVQYWREQFVCERRRTYQRHGFTEIQTPD